MNILLIGGGGREHALAYALKKSKKLKKLYVSPGNPGIGAIAELVKLDIDNHQDIIKFCRSENINLVVIGPEAPLVAGLADDLTKHKILCFGPSKSAARLEGSKIFTKYICEKYNIPTAAYKEFDNATEAVNYVKNCSFPQVIKADGLAAGKGVIIAENFAAAESAIKDMLVNKIFGKAADRIIIEEFLEGEEASFFAVSDGKNVIKFGSAQDHKRAYDNDKGPNTGGMGTYSPAPVVTKEIEDYVMSRIINPLVKGMAAENAPYQGVIFAGLMIGKSGTKLLEINVRFGDPETQSLMLRLESDPAQIFYDCAAGKLADQEVKLSDLTAICVVMAAKGYPGDYKKNTLIKLPKNIADQKNITIFHAGTKTDNNNNLLSSGGRVLGVSALGTNINEARKTAYELIELIDWPEGFYRKDIGGKAI